MTTIKLSGGDLGEEEMYVRCNLSQASAPVEVRYSKGHGWKGTQYQCADARHRTPGLIDIGKSLAARAVEVQADDFDCDAEDVPQAYVASDGNGRQEADDWDDLLEIVGDWYDGSYEWAEKAEAVEGVDLTVDTDGLGEGDLAGLRDRIADTEGRIAESLGAESFAGHGNYYVSASSAAGLQLTVEAVD